MAKNFSIPATVKIGTNKETKCEFRIHDGRLFWHGAPKAYAQPEHDRYIWPKNACIGEATELSETTIRTTLQNYFDELGCGPMDWTLTCGDIREVNERQKRDKSEATTEATEPKPRKPRTTKSETTTEPKPETIAEATAETTTEVATEVATEPATEATTEPAPMDEAEATEAVEDALLSADDVQLVMALRRMRGTAVDEATVEKIVLRVIDKFATDEKVAPRLKKAAKKVAATKDDDEIRCKDFDDMVEDLSDGFYIYLEGPAGTGKSHTAEQIAKYLGLDFYCQTTIQFAHDVRGYGDAGGNYIGTPFYEAFSKGGLFFQDEYDRSFAEAAIVQNTALANGYYDFPVVGRVQAHPNFRFMAAGNTKMTGADDEYVTGQVLDASSRDRFATYYHVDYDKRIELKIANGDKSLVDFMFDVRQSIKKCGIKHVVSYRATKYLAARNDTTERMKKAIERSLFKGLNRDDMRVVYGQLKNKDNRWAAALGEIVG